MASPKGYDVKWNTSDRERQILYDFIYMWTLKKQVNKQQDRVIEIDKKQNKTGGYQRRGTSPATQW